MKRVKALYLAHRSITADLHSSVLRRLFDDNPAVVRTLILSGADVKAKAKASAGNEAMDEDDDDDDEEEEEEGGTDGGARGNAEMLLSCCPGDYAAQSRALVKRVEACLRYWSPSKVWAEATQAAPLVQSLLQCLITLVLAASGPDGEDDGMALESPSAATGSKKNAADREIIALALLERLPSSVDVQKLSQLKDGSRAQRSMLKLWRYCTSAATELYTSSTESQSNLVGLFGSFSTDVIPLITDVSTKLSAGENCARWAAAVERSLAGSFAQAIGKSSGPALRIMESLRSGSISFDGMIDDEEDDDEEEEGEEEKTN